MRSALVRAGAVLSTAALVVAGLEAVSYAATGSLMVAGVVNSESSTTTIVNTGTTSALKLVMKNHLAPPFVTNATGLVTNLNADMLGGYHVMTFLSGMGTTKGFTFVDGATPHALNTNFLMSKIPSGIYLVTVNGILTLKTGGHFLTGTTIDASPVLQHFTCGFSLALLRSPLLGEYSSDLLNGAEVAPSFTIVANISSLSTYQLACTSTTGDGWSSIVPLSVTFVKLDSNYVRPLTIGP